MTVLPRPGLPDGLIAFVKQDCPTCTLVEPVLQELEAAGVLSAVYTQDDRSFPAVDNRIDDTSLEFSFRHDIETVPTLMKVDDGAETDRIVGWSRDMWAGFTGIDSLGLDAGITDFSPGCGSMSVDPDLRAGLEARYGSGFASREVEFATAEDEHEAMYDRGWSDGLPLVPPTPERVARMLEGTTRDRHDVVALVPPNLVECTVEKVAVNAVMAGCKPEYLPVIITALEAACTDEFKMHGLLCTTMPVGPIMLVNGPITRRIEMNSGGNVLGQGNRANATIGRAMNLVIRNVGGGEPGGIDRAAHGGPHKIGLCFAEDEENSPWESYAVQQGFAPDQSTVTLFAGDGPRCVVDQLTRDPEGLAKSLAMNINANIHPKLVMGFDTMLVIGPEHASRFADAGWSKQQLHDAVIAGTVRDADTILRGVDGVAEGVPDFLAGNPIPKIRPDGGLMIVHAGGDAGLFSAIMNGWVNGDTGSRPVTKEITP
ncbi:MAG: thioredoxin family protein [Actinomycetota bacterium]